MTTRYSNKAMSRNGRPVLSDAEFRKIVDRHKVDYKALAEITGKTWRTIRSYYYGERKIPLDVAEALVELAGAQIDFAADAPAPSEPWYVSLVTRITSEAQAKVLSDNKLLRKSVAAMCKSCEPMGLCRQSECALRPVSPLPLRALRAS